MSGALDGFKSHRHRHVESPASPGEHRGRGAFFVLRSRLSAARAAHRQNVWTGSDVIVLRIGASPEARDRTSYRCATGVAPQMRAETSMPCAVETGVPILTLASPGAVEGGSSCPLQQPSSSSS